MLNRIHLISLEAVVLAFAQLVVAGDTLDSVEQAVTARWEKHKSFSAAITLSMEMNVGDGKITSSGQGTLEYVRKSDETLFRMEMTTRTVQLVRGQETTGEKKITSISDGKHLYSLTETMGRPTAVREKAEDAKMGVGGRAIFRQMRTEFNLKVLPEDKLDGKGVYVIEATPRQPGRSPFAKTVFYFRKDIGMMVQMVGFGADGRKIQTMSYTDIKLNPTIDPKRFVFKAPEGVTVIDRTKK